MPSKVLYAQMPVHNIIRLAAWDSNALLGMWDLDEFLVLPSNTKIHSLLDGGCLGRVLSANKEVTFNMSWMVLPTSRISDLREWSRYTSWHAAVHGLSYQHIPYSNCMNACKSVIVPSAPWNYQVHSTSRMAFQWTTVPVECGMLLHFSNLWHRRKRTHNPGSPQLFNKSLVPLPLQCDAPLRVKGVQHAST